MYKLGRFVEVHHAQSYDHGDKRLAVYIDSASQCEELEAEAGEQWTDNSRKLELR